MAHSQRFEPLNEEWSDALKNKVFRLEPRNEAFSVFVLHAAKAHKCVHLMNIPPHGFCHQSQPMDEGSVWIRSRNFSPRLSRHTNS